MARGTGPARGAALRHQIGTTLAGALLVLAAAGSAVRRAAARAALRDDVDRLAGELLVPVAFAGGAVVGLLLSRAQP